MNRSAPRSIDQYLNQLRGELAGEDAALLQDALYDAEEYLRAEVAAHPEKSESDILELIASTYGAPDEVAAAYRDTEAKVKAALRTPRQPATSRLGKLLSVYLDPRTYTSVFFMLLSLATGVLYFVFAVVGVSLSAGLAVLVIGVPFFLVFMALIRVISLAEGRLIEAMTGSRMPRRPPHPGAPGGFWSRVADMLTDRRTWSTLLYLVLMLPLGIAYFVIAVVGLSVSMSLIFAPFVGVAERLGIVAVHHVHVNPEWLDTVWGLPLLFAAGVLLLTVVMHVSRGIGRLHARYAKALLVARG